MSESNETLPLPSQESETDLRYEHMVEQYPTPEDWIALQGGRPRVFRNPDNPSSRWIVLHVYDEHDDEGKRFKNGSVVETMPPGEKFKIGLFNVDWKNEEGEHIARSIRAPLMMVNRFHGDPCTERSRAAGSSEAYSRIGSQTSYKLYIDELIKMGMQEVKFSMTPSGYAFRPLPKIRQPRPLHSPPDA